MRFLRIFTVVAFMAISLPASATHITPLLIPDIIIPSGLSLSYDPTLSPASYDLTVSGGAGFALRSDFSSYFTIAGGNFNLQAKFDGGIFTDGFFSITGNTVGYLPASGPTLLTGNILEFEYDGTPGNDPDPFVFILETTGGDLASIFGPFFAVTLHIDTDPSVNPDVGSLFDNAFSGTNGRADVQPVPEPTSGLLALVGGFFVMRRVRRVAHSK